MTHADPRASARTLSGAIGRIPGEVRVPAPTLVVLGESDRSVTPGVLTRLRALLPAAELRTIPEAGHFVCLDNPHAFDEAVVAFMGVEPAPTEPG